MFPKGLAIGALLLVFLLTGCGPRGGTGQNPGNPKPVNGPPADPGTLSPPRRDPSAQGTGGLPDRDAVPVRPDQAPLVRIQDALEVDSLLGRRVRVTGRCTAAGVGRQAGSWTLAEGGAAIEVRGLIPFPCDPNRAINLTIFAQIEPKTAGSPERLLLRLPD